MMTVIPIHDEVFMTQAACTGRTADPAIQIQTRTFSKDTR